jgi:glycosyltransferase involved in cell wall biosynthesis
VAQQVTSVSRPLRVLHVSVSIGAELGGPATVCAGLTSALAERGHQVTVATLSHGNQTPLPLNPAVALKSFPIDGIERYSVSHPLARWLEENVGDFDVVHLHSIWQYPTFAGARACWAARVPYVVALHGMLDHYSVHAQSTFLKRLYWMLRERRVESRAAVLHCLNRAEIRKAVPWIRNMPKFVLPNGIDAADLAALPPRGVFRAQYPQWAQRPLVLFLSRLHPKKGLERLFPAWKQLAQAGGPLAQACLLVAGTGEPEYVASLKQIAADLGLGDQVYFLGQLIGRQKWQALVDSDVFVLPSHQEGFSMAITEALAAGCTPVVTEECNFDELELPAPQPPCGIIIRNGDMATFARAVGDLLNDPARRCALADVGRAVVLSRYTWQRIAADLESIYGRLVAGEKFPADPTM